MAVTVSLLCLVISGCSLTDPEQRCKEQAALGAHAFQERRFVEAEKAYESAVDAAKGSTNALQYPLMLRELAKCFEADHKYAEAESAYESAIKAYADLSKRGSHFDNSSVSERQYETLAALAGCYFAQENYPKARDTYEQVKALGDKIVEPLAMSSEVNQNYIRTLEKCGQGALAAKLKSQTAASTCTLEEFDERLTKVGNNLVSAKFAGVDAELDSLHLASKGFSGSNPREGRILTLIGLMKLAHNQPSEAEVVVRNALSNSNSTQDPIADRSADWTLLGLATELQGDTVSSIKTYKKAFRLQPYHPIEILSIVAAGMKENGFASQAKRVVDRIRWFQTDDQFNLKPSTAIEFVQLSNEQDRQGHTSMAEATRLTGLQHLEKTPGLSSAAELRGAYQLYKIFRTEGKSALAERALKQMRIIGETSPERKKQLQQALQQQGLSVQ